MHTQDFASDIPLPRHWPRYVRTAVLHSISLAHTALTWSRSWAADSSLQRVRLAARLEQAGNEVELLREELRIRDRRMGKLPAQRGPYYRPTDRMAILELRAARGWTLAETARTFLIEPQTVANWMSRADETGDRPLVGLPEPVNRFPAHVRYLVRRLKTLCPTMGKRRIAKTLARAGLHLGVTTVGRMLNNPEGKHRVEASAMESLPADETRVVTAGRPNHVWHVDLTVVPTRAGFWVPWRPFAQAPSWPFCWWVALAVDHYSRCVVGFAEFPRQPSSVEVRSFLGRAIRLAGEAPRHLISDHGSQFTAAGFRRWCARRGLPWSGTREPSAPVRTAESVAAR